VETLRESGRIVELRVFSGFCDLGETPPGIVMDGVSSPPEK
jgi:hypothetical protein